MPREHSRRGNDEDEKVTAIPRRPLPSLRALVAGLVDYAGLFPPAALEMPAATAHYAKYLRSPDAWMLGRFVVPAARLGELAAVAAQHRLPRSAPWRLSALLGDDMVGDVSRVEAFNTEHGGAFIVDAVEARADSAERVRALSDALTPALVAYVELPLGGELRELLDVVGRARVRAKVRTGGVTAESIPPPAQVARFLMHCAELRVPFKATAGLHHPLRGEYRLTYETGAPSATMFGFINLFVAAALAATGASEADLAAVLEERDPAAFEFLASGLRWHHREVSVDQIAAARASFAVAFGSCSFREPVDDLHEMELL
jgi:hypothetical protein